MGSEDGREIQLSQNELRLKIIIDRLQQFLSQGLLHFHISNALRAAFAERKINQARFFFAGALWANFETSAMYIARLVDTHKDSTNIYHMLSYIEQTGSRSLPRANPADVLLKISEHRAELGNLDSKTLALRQWRDKLLAHIDKAYIENPLKVYAEFPLSIDDLSVLFDELAKILNYWSGLLENSEWRNESLKEGVDEDIEFLVGLMNK